MKKKLFNASKHSKELDNLWSKAVRARDKRCVMCFKTDNLHAHHWLHRKSRSLQTRWDINNGVTLCYACHMYKLHGNQSDAHFLEEFLLKCKTMFSEDERNELDRKAVSSDIRKTLFYMEQIKNDLNNYLLSL